MSQAMPVLPVLPAFPDAPVPPAAVLAYAREGDGPRSPLVRVGGWFGFVAVALWVLFVPVLYGGVYFDYHSHASGGYDQACSRLVPLFQAFLGGVGLALVLTGKVQTRGRRYPGYALALCLNLVPLVLIATELKHEPASHPPARWISLSAEL